MNKQRIKELGFTVLIAFFLATAIGTMFVKYDGYSYPAIALRQEAITIANNSGLCENCADGISQYTISSPTKAGYDVTCSDTDGCRLYIGETGAGIKLGMLFDVANAGTNAITVVENASINVMSGATVALGTDDVLVFKRNRANTLWRQVAPVGNN